MNLFRKHPLLLATAAVLAGGLAFAFWPRPAEVELATVTHGPLQVTVNEDGKTRIRERYAVATPVGGRLLRVELHPGDAVEAGRTVLAVVEPTAPEMLDARSRAQAEARAKAAEAALGQATPQRDRAQTALEFARTELARAQQLYQSGAASHTELDAAEQREHLAAEDLRSAEFAVRVAGFEWEQARAALLHAEGRAAEPGDGQLEIRSPVSGRVLRVFQESATPLTAGARLLEVGDPADLEVEVEVLSIDAVRIRPGAKVLLDHWGGPAPLAARVRLVEPAGFTKVSALGVEEQRVRVIADFTDPPDRRAGLADAFRVEARIITWETDRALKVPVGALFRHGEVWAVFTASNGRARLRSVTLGHRNDQEAEVLGGLEADTPVIVHPSDQIRDGRTVMARVR